MAVNKRLNKEEMIKLLTETYGYKEEELKNKDGKFLSNAQLEALIKKAKQEKDEIENNLPEPAEAPVEEEEEEDILDELHYEYENKKLNIKDDDLIPVMNGLTGGLTHKSVNTGRIWKFESFGQIEKMPFSEIVSLMNRNPKVFHECWLIILNREIQEYYGLTEKYRYILTPKNVEKIFKKDISQLRHFIENAPIAMKVTFFHKARELYQQGRLDSVKKIKFIQDTFGISLEDNAPLDEIVNIKDE